MSALPARGGASAWARVTPVSPPGHPGSRKVALDRGSLQELLLLEGKTIRKTGTGTGCSQGFSPFREAMDHRRQEPPAWLPIPGFQQLQGTAGKGPSLPSLGSALAAALEWLNLAPASSALTALVKLRALVGASKAERLCSSQGREHRELQELGLQEMELMSCLRGKFGVREEQGDKTRRAWIPEREELVLRYLPLTRIPRAFIPRSSFLIRE